MANANCSVLQYRSEIFKVYVCVCVYWGFSVKDSLDCRAVWAGRGGGAVWVGQVFVGAVWAG